MDEHSNGGPVDGDVEDFPTQLRRLKAEQRQLREERRRRFEESNRLLDAMFERCGLPQRHPARYHIVDDWEMYTKDPPCILPQGHVATNGRSAGSRIIYYLSLDGLGEVRLDLDECPRRFPILDVMHCGTITSLKSYKAFYPIPGGRWVEHWVEYPDPAYTEDSPSVGWREVSPAHVAFMLGCDPEALQASLSDPGESTPEAPALQRDTVENRALAIALQMITSGENPSIAAIAKILGCQRTFLYRCPRLQTFIGAHKNERESLPRGRKDRKTGELEAW